MNNHQNQTLSSIVATKEKCLARLFRANIRKKPIHFVQLVSIRTNSELKTVILEFSDTSSILISAHSSRSAHLVAHAHACIIHFNGEV